MDEVRGCDLVYGHEKPRYREPTEGHEIASEIYSISFVIRDIIGEEHEVFYGGSYEAMAECS